MTLRNQIEEIIKSANCSTDQATSAICRLLKNQMEMVQIPLISIYTNLGLTIQYTNGNTEQVAIAICRHLDRQLGLAGNGWFDDDKELLSLLRE